MNPWISTTVSTPPLVDGESEWVLVWSQRKAIPRVAKLVYREDVTAEPPEPAGYTLWLEFGPDGYYLTGVTHWMPMPPGPSATDTTTSTPPPSTTSHQ